MTPEAVHDSHGAGKWQCLLLITFQATVCFFFIIFDIGESELDYLKKYKSILWPLNGLDHLTFPDILTLMPRQVRWIQLHSRSIHPKNPRFSVALSVKAESALLFPLPSLCMEILTPNFCRGGCVTTHLCAGSWSWSHSVHNVYVSTSSAAARLGCGLEETPNFSSILTDAASINCHLILIKAAGGAGAHTSSHRASSRNIPFTGHQSIMGHTCTETDKDAPLLKKLLVRTEADCRGQQDTKLLHMVRL